MSSNQIGRLQAPIKIVQHTLNKFDPSLPESKTVGLIRRVEQKVLINGKNRYTTVMTRENTVEIEEIDCLDCGRRLVKNGYNNRLIILDRGLGQFRFRIQRKRCPYCGEIKPDYSSLAPRYRNYHGNYARISRQLNMEGLVPSQIAEAIRICLDVSISISTIIRWIEEVAESLREMLQKTDVPNSGYWGYDEIYMLVGGRKRYQITTVDLVTKFIPTAYVTASMGRKTGKRVLLGAKRRKGLVIKGIVKDCTTNLGDTFTKHGWKHIKQQNCKMHVKWIVSKHVKAFLGISRQSLKPIPKEWLWLLRRFYGAVEAHNETDAIIKLIILKNIILRLKGERVRHLKTAVRQLHGWLPKILAHNSDPNLSSTNNLCESFHKKYLRYPSFKRNMRTISGAQRVSDFIRFKHNLRQFEVYFESFRKKREQYDRFKADFPGDPLLHGQGIHFKAKQMHLEESFGEYSGFWNLYIRKI